MNTTEPIIEFYWEGEQGKVEQSFEAIVKLGEDKTPTECMVYITSEWYNQDKDKTFTRVDLIAIPQNDTKRRCGYYWSEDDQEWVFDDELNAYTSQRLIEKEIDEAKWYIKRIPEAFEKYHTKVIEELGGDVDKERAEMLEKVKAKTLYIEKLQEEYKLRYGNEYR